MNLTCDNAVRFAGRTETTGDGGDNYANEYHSLNQLITVNKNGAVVERCSYGVTGSRTSRKTGANKDTASYTKG